ncbi:MAG TPA: NADH:ubiquinone reductase (Na(+)-transporting) subunit E, partial [Alphaproteobacteria bacterium]|nr:NADH:ubiquinone reductase (Na(+)-transporting) subunit E [Alphaproteobacteria bacterium]
MERFIDIVVKAVFMENLALAYLLGMCTFLA